MFDVTATVLQHYSPDHVLVRIDVRGLNPVVDRVAFDLSVPKSKFRGAGNTLSGPKTLDFFSLDAAKKIIESMTFNYVERVHEQGGGTMAQTRMWFWKDGPIRRVPRPAVGRFAIPMPAVANPPPANPRRDNVYDQFIVQPQWMGPPQGDAQRLAANPPRAFPPAPVEWLVIDDLQGDPANDPGPDPNDRGNF